MGAEHIYLFASVRYCQWKYKIKVFILNANMSHIFIDIKWDISIFQCIPNVQKRKIDTKLIDFDKSIDKCKQQKNLKKSNFSDSILRMVLRFPKEPYEHREIPIMVFHASRFHMENILVHSAVSVPAFVTRFIQHIDDQEFCMNANAKIEWAETEWCEMCTKISYTEENFLFSHSIRTGAQTIIESDEFSSAHPFIYTHTYSILYILIIIAEPRHEW